MDRVRVFVDGDLSVAIVEDVSDELKEHLRSNLNAYCYGSELAGEDLSYYSFNQTVVQLLERYDAKEKSLRLGMAGELLVHLVFPGEHFDLTSGGIFFNKEEKNIKKGFDLMFLEGTSSGVWYGEVKSGETSSDPDSDSEHSTDGKVHSLLMEAARDLASKLRADAPRSRWDSAIIDASLALTSGEADTMKKLLRRDSQVVQAEGQLPANAVLAGVVFHNYEHCEVTESQVRATAASIAGSGKSTRVRVVAAQQNVYDGLISFLRSEVADNA